MSSARWLSAPLILSFVALTLGGPSASARSAVATTPIQHVVVLYMENHAFDNVLGHLCVADSRCDGSITGQTHTGKTINLPSAADTVPGIAHNQATQLKAINGGAMNGWDTINTAIDHPLAPEEILTCFRAKAGPNTPQLCIEWEEEDHSRWLATHKGRADSSTTRRQSNQSRHRRKRAA